LKPAGTPISGAINIQGHIGTGPLRRAVRVVDRVHGDGELPAIRMARAAIDPDRWGYYRHGGLGIYVQAGLHPHPDLTGLHEIGHWLDNLAFGGNRVDYHASEESPLLEEWRSAVRATRAYHNLVRLRDDPATMIETRAKIGALLTDRECFSRSYAQYIAMQSGDAVLLRQLDRRLQRAGDITAFWEHEDFRPIADALDRLFQRQGWLQ
jgi:hypothetical protein